MAPCLTCPRSVRPASSRRATLTLTLILTLTLTLTLSLAPKAAADGAFADASSAVAGDLVLMVRSSTPSYTGFQVSFASGTVAPPYACAGGGAIPFSRGCYKAPFTVPAGDAFTAVRVPFHAFSDKWSPSTGE